MAMNSMILIPDKIDKIENALKNEKNRKGIEVKN
jgi:hypothetical protein